jgi:hypothetical protein
MRVIHLVIAGVLTIAIGVATPASGLARATTTGLTTAGPARCGKCAHNLDVNQHWFTGECDSGSDCYDCVAFNSCHSNTQNPYQCSAFHWLCGSALATLDQVERAAWNDDSETKLRSLAETLPGRIRIDDAGYLLVRGCDGTLIAAYRLDAGPDASTLPHRSLAQALGVMTSETRFSFPPAQSLFSWPMA